TTFTPPAAGSSRRYRGRFLHRRSHQIRKRREFSAVDDGFPITPVFDQACAFQLFKVEGNERWAGIAQGCGNGPRRHAFRACKDQKADGPQADFVGQGRKSGQGSFFFHINSTLQESFDR
ncbi:hypothetical protein, partial [Paracoccus marcusii]|uniref:hypothetical protein n=1 Tax=Paracoccus marcusii TaxID=59779 RepID=UPI003CD0D8AC